MVYAWGRNNYGQVGPSFLSDQPTPRKVYIGPRRCISIACGQKSSMAVTNNGEVYGWGYNANGQLGVGSIANLYSPSKIESFQGIVIQKIVCGYAHTMALSDEGVLYAWGANSYGQLGTGNKTNQISPVRIASEIGRVIEIAASYYNNISAAMTETFKVFMWGECRKHSVTNPTETAFHSLHDVFACFASAAVTWVPMKLYICDTTRVNDSLCQAFDDKETSDLMICVEGKVIHVHKAILKIRSQHFRIMLQTHWEEDKECLVNVFQFSYAVYYAFLRYLYTDEVDLPPEDAIGLLELADCYCDSQLKRHCQQIIKHGITIDNVSTLYAAALKYKAKELEQFAFGFALNHLTAVAQTASFEKLDEETVKNFIRKVAQHGGFKC